MTEVLLTHLDLLMFVVAIAALLRGYPVAFTLAGIGLVFALLGAWFACPQCRYHLPGKGAGISRRHQVAIARRDRVADAAQLKGDRGRAAGRRFCRHHAKPFDVSGHFRQWEYLYRGFCQADLKIAIRHPSEEGDFVLQMQRGNLLVDLSLLAQPVEAVCRVFAYYHQADIPFAL